MKQREEKEGKQKRFGHRKQPKLDDIIEMKKRTKFKREKYLNYFFFFPDRKFSFSQFNETMFYNWITFNLSIVHISLS